jgi:hypothetical protein
MFDVKPKCIYRHLRLRFTRQVVIADGGNGTIKVVIRKNEKKTYYY